MTRARRSLSAVFAVLLLAATSQLTINLNAQQKAAFVRLDRVTASHALPNGIEIRSGAAVMQITALRDDVLRVRVGPAGQLPEDASWAVLPSSRTANINVTPESNGTAVGFKTEKLHVTVHKDPFGLAVTDNAKHVIAQDLPGRPIEYHGDVVSRVHEVASGRALLRAGRQAGSARSAQRGVHDWNTDAFGWQQSTDPIYKSIPWLITFNKGVCAGIYFDNTWRASFDFNKEYRDGYSFGSEGGPLDFYVLYGPEPKNVVETWAWLVGTTPMPPMWSLGYQQSRYSYYPEAEVKRNGDKLRANTFPRT